MRLSGCLALLAVIAAIGFFVHRLTSGGRLIFVAPIDSELRITIDSRAPVTIAPRGFTDARVSMGTHTVNTATRYGERTITLEANLSDALLVPAADEQCFLVLDVAEAYANSSTVLPAGWAPPVAASLSSEVVVAPKHIWITDAPARVRRDPGAPTRILYPYECNSSAPAAVEAWLAHTFGRRK